jgi:glycoprotein-N-acetylgalactosamine 3-beta-galactosyltransferase
MTTEHVEDLNTVELKLWGPEGRDKLWTKSKLAWLHVYEHYRDTHDWFMKADDDTYVVFDNLREFLSQYNTMEPHHFGRRFQMGQKSYYSGGSGIILSKEALLRMGNAFPDAEADGWSGGPRGTGPEDLLTSVSLAPLGVKTVEAVDKHGRQLFFPMGLDHEWFAPQRDENAWFYRYSKVAKVGRECCSDDWVSVHYTPTPKMYTIDALEEIGCEMDVHEWPHLRLRPPPP